MSAMCQKRIFALYPISHAFGRRHGAAGPGSTQRTETCTKVVHNRCRLLPRREVTAFRVPLIVDQLGVGFFGPTPRGRAYFIREHTYDRGDGNPFRCKEGELVLPIETCRRNTRVR